jgi:hypothetical protein
MAPILVIVKIGFSVEINKSSENLNVKKVMKFSAHFDT